MEIRSGVPLAGFTSWQVGGPADFFCQPENESDVETALKFAWEKKIPWTVLGGGTNVLVSDRGVEGLVIGMQKLRACSVDIVDEKPNIECEAGTPKSELLKIFLKHKSPAALFVAGLPGDVGGGLVMNAGVAEAMAPREFHEIVKSFDVLRIDDGGVVRRHTFTHEQVRWTYRHSERWQPGIIVRARLGWFGPPDPDILLKVREANLKRSSKQPLDQPSCGSVFKNPEGHKAAQLIDGCGLKGFAAGGAQVSPKHANFIVNTGGATAADIDAVISHVRETVLARKGVALVTEVVRLGRF